MWGALRDVWTRFDVLGRKFIDRANPILGARDQEILADLQRRKNAKDVERRG